MHLLYHHLHLVYHHLSGTLPSLSGTPTIPVWYPTCVWYPTTLLEPHPCLELHHVSGTPSHPLSGIPPQCPTTTILAHSTPPPSGHCCSYLASNCPLPLIWPQPTHHLELLLHATPTTPSNCHLVLMHLPSPPSWLSGPPCNTAPPPLAPCHQPPAPPPLPSGPSAPPPQATAIWPSCPLLSLPPLPSGTPGPTPCPIWPPAIAPAPTTPTPIWTSYPHPTKYHHQRFPPPKKEI